MKLHFDQISEKAYYLPLDNKQLLLKEEEITVTFAGQLVFHRKKRTDVVMLHGEIEGKLVGRCALCAVDTPFYFKEDFAYRLVVGTEFESDLSDIECKEENVELLCLEKPEIDLDEILQEQVYLNMPMQLLCDNACRGICPRCGANLNVEKCGCAEVSSSSPFAVLVELKKH